MQRPPGPAVLAPVLALALSACAHAPAAPGVAPNFVVSATSPDGDAVAQVTRVLAEARRRAERWGPLPATVGITIHPSAEALAAAVGRPGSDWLRGWARQGAVDVVAPRGWSRGKASDDAMTTLLAHELAHCVLFHRLGAGWSRRDVPAWFEEGMATFASGERPARSDGPSLLARPGAPSPEPPATYASADRAFRDLVETHGESSVRSVIDGLAAGIPFDRALLAATAPR